MAQSISFGDFTNVVVPNLSPGVPALITKLSSDEIDLAEVAETLELHPVIAARLIGLSNSAWSAPDRAIVDLHTACVRLGLNVVKSSSIAYALAAPFNALKCQTFDPRRFWTCTLLAAEAAAYLSARYQLEYSVARTAGMLRNLGLIWLADLAPEQCNEALVRAAEEEDATDLSTALNLYVGINHLEATKRLLTAWEIPDALLDACEDERKCPLALVSAQGSSVASSVCMGLEIEEDPANPESSNATLAATFRATSKQLDKLTMVAQSIAV